MKLCDRCRVSGCLLTYGGKACREARKQECSDVVFTRADKIREMDDEELAVVVMCPHDGDEKVIYSCVDQEHNTWNCRGCGYIETFEADGPVENGWNFCPGCGHEIEVEAVSPCPFDNGNCMCQFCEAQCNNGLNCSDCRCEGKPVHDIHLCTGFVGDITQYIRNWMRHHGGKAET